LQISRVKIINQTGSGEDELIGSEKETAAEEEEDAIIVVLGRRRASQQTFC
jgi:hypothetical protein